MLNKLSFTYRDSDYSHTEQHAEEEEHGPKMAQKGPKTAPKMAQAGPKKAPRWPKTARSKCHE